MAQSDSIPAVSIRTQCGSYPSAEYCFSPQARYPEYPFRDLAGAENSVYGHVRDLFRQEGLDAANFGTPQWNPLGAFVRPGARVFVLPNFVFHIRSNESRARFDAKCTHGSVLRALLDYVFIAAGPSARVSLGNAPLQSCDWSRVTRDTSAMAICSFYERNGLKLNLCDLRGLVRQEDVLGRSASIERRDAHCEIRFDLGTESLLSDLDLRSPHYRVAGYDPAATESYHQKNHHIYVLNREIVEADVVISVPKLKTHEKVGITCALKGLVGTISQKECLAHHRFGSPQAGGDEYPKAARLARALSGFHDYVQSHRSGGYRQQAIEIAERTLARIYSHAGGLRYGAWHGNDTAWRMTLDIAKLVTFGTAEGKVQRTPARSHLVLVDGITGGEGDGPLNPTPVDSRTLIFSDNAALADYAACLLMGYEPQRLPLIRIAFSHPTHSIFRGDVSSVAAILNGEKVLLPSLAKVQGHKFLPPRGWRNYF
jgi:uncharacterized protein (DUF362 family)